MKLGVRHIQAVGGKNMNKIHSGSVQLVLRFQIIKVAVWAHFSFDCAKENACLLIKLQNRAFVKTENGE